MRTAQLISGYSHRNEDLDRLVESLGIKRHICVQMEQVHGNHFKEIREHDINGSSGKRLVVPGVDAIYTRLTNVALVVRWADCLPIMFSHSSGLIGVIHAGRRGTEASISQRVVTQVISETKVSARSPLHIWLGPCICQNCYQIDRAHNIHYDLLKMNQQQIHSVLKEQNLNESSIQVELDNSCTLCSTDQFYSYRKEGAGVAMNYAVIARVSQ